VFVISAIMELLSIVFAATLLRLLIRRIGAGNEFLYSWLQYMLNIHKDDMTDAEWLSWFESRQRSKEPLNLQKFLLDSFLDIILILTFGIIFPLINIPLVLILILKLRRRRQTLMTVMSFANETREMLVELQKSLEEECTSLFRGRPTLGAKRIFLVFPAAFLALVVLDVVGDSTPLVRGFWLSIIMVCSPTFIYHIIPEAATIQMAYMLRAINERPTVNASGASSGKFMVENPIPRHVPYPAALGGLTTSAALNDGCGVNPDENEVFKRLPVR